MIYSAALSGFMPSCIFLFHCVANSYFYANISLLHGALHAQATCRKTNVGGGGTDVTELQAEREMLMC